MCVSQAEVHQFKPLRPSNQNHSLCLCHFKHHHWGCHSIHRGHRGLGSDVTRPGAPPRCDISDVSPQHWHHYNHNNHQQQPDSADSTESWQERCWQQKPLSADTVAAQSDTISTNCHFQLNNTKACCLKGLNSLCSTGHPPTLEKHCLQPHCSLINGAVILKVVKPTTPTFHLKFPSVTRHEKLL